jgi:hypothetical protein
MRTVTVGLTSHCVRPSLTSNQSPALPVGNMHLCLYMRCRSCSRRLSVIRLVICLLPGLCCAVVCNFAKISIIDIVLRLRRLLKLSADVSTLHYLLFVNSRVVSIEMVGFQPNVNGIGDMNCYYILVIGVLL